MEFQWLKGGWMLSKQVYPQTLQANRDKLECSFRKLSMWLCNTVLQAEE